MQLKNGYVKIKPFDNPEKIGNIYLPQGFITNDYLSIAGEVVDVPRELPYFGREAETLRAQEPDGYTRSAQTQEKLSTLNNRSMNFDTDIEVKKGDVVVYDWKVRAFIENTNVDGDFMLLRYDSLIAVITENGYKMLNGYMFVEPCIEKINSALAIDGFEKKSEQLAIVAHEGSLVKHYREIPYAVDLPMSLKGRKVLVRKSRMKKLEKVYMGLFDKEYMIIQRKDILAYE